MRTLLSIIFITLFPIPLLVRDDEVKTGVNLLCEELDTKSYYADGAMQNVKKDGESLEVNMTANEATLKYPSMRIIKKHVWTSGIMDTHENWLRSFPLFLYWNDPILAFNKQF